MAWHRYTLVVLGLTVSLCVQKGNSDDTSTANEMIQKMNLSANACEDFNEFACGRFIKEAKIPDGKSEVTTFTIIADANQAVLNEIILEKVEATDPQYLINIKRFYNSCIDVDTIEAVGLTPYLNEREFVDDWPTLNPNWSGANFDLNEVIVRYSKVFVNPIFRLYPSSDMADSNRMAIFLREANVVLDQESYSLPRNSPILQAYETYLIEFAVELNASREVAERDAKDMIDLEIEIAKIMPSREQQRNAMKQHNAVHLHQLSTMYPELDIAGFARALFGLANVTLTSDEKIFNLAPAFMENISMVIGKFSNRTIQNLFGFIHAINRVGGLTLRLRQIAQEFLMLYYGYEAETPRWKDCMDVTSNVFPMGISKQFVNRVFSQRAKRDVNDMIGNIKEVFKKMIEDTTWMSNETKTEALVKLAKMKQKIGYPDVDFEEADIEKKYRHFIMSAVDFYGNGLLVINLNNLEFLAEYRKPVDKKIWNIPPYKINAYFSNGRNEIGLLAGIMQRPFYSETFKDYMNYGSFGMVIGHEMTHGFDDFGKHFDENGNLRDWWTPEDKESFANKTQCIIDQISNTLVDEVNMTLNGEHTAGETIAERGGLEVAFRAYKEHVRKSSEQARLPGLNLTQDQVFFLSFAQMYCDKVTRERLISQVNSDRHPPGKYRIIGTLQNSKSFAKAYNCTRGSFMNPEIKCNVW